MDREITTWLAIGFIASILAVVLFYGGVSFLHNPEPPSKTVDEPRDLRIDNVDSVPYNLTINITYLNGESNKSVFSNKFHLKPDQKERIENISDRRGDHLVKVTVNGVTVRKRWTIDESTYGLFVYVNKSGEPSITWAVE